MKITKIGHCCLVIKDQGKTVLTDPGIFSDGQNKITGIDIVLITHEHQDHLHIDSLKIILQNNPQAAVVTNSGVGKLLDKENIPYQLLEDGNKKMFDGLLIEAFGNEHANIYPSILKVQNTGYLISKRLYYPGDAFTMPGKQVEILALPVIGPWLHIAEAINFALAIRPKYAFPVHDGFLKFGGPFYNIPKGIIEPQGIKFIEPEKDQPTEF
ncbi:MAG: MBL fold metallo-hydrolase [Patescibacteria group bacterium]|nr:MBL fold metallo-hydrolase [Patescibacteria group bacterium]